MAIWLAGSCQHNGEVSVQCMSTGVEVF